MIARQKRERGKAHRKGTKPNNPGRLAKARAPGDAIEPIEEELSRRENLTTATTTQADLSRHALELKLSRPGPPHPSSGRSASEGMKPKERQKPLRVGASKGEVGRVSQEGKVAQARKDSGDR